MDFSYDKSSKNYSFSTWRNSQKTLKLKATFLISKMIKY